jgi:ABC-type multidrug transport system fused ATPase/permease subunit
MVLLVGAQLLSLAVPFYFGRAINSMQEHGLSGLHEAGVFLVRAFCVVIAGWLLHGPGRVLERKVALLIRRRLTTQLTDRLMALPLVWQESQHSQSLSHRVQRSTQAMFTFAENQYRYIGSATRLAGPIVALMLIDLRVGVAAICGLVLVNSAARHYDRRLIKLAEHEVQAERQFTLTLGEMLINSVSRLALRQTRGISAILGVKLEDIFAPLRKALIANEIKWCIVDVGLAAMNCALIVLYVWLKVIENHSVPSPQGIAPTTPMLLGDIYMVWVYAQQTGTVSASLAENFQQFARMLVDYRSCEAISTAKAEARASRPVTRESWRRVDICSLSFARSGDDRGNFPIQIRALSLERRRSYALVGPSGSGKSTLLRLLAGLYQPDEIKISFDSAAEIRDPQQAMSILRLHSTLVSQNVEVFAGTLAQNLQLCESNIGPVRSEEFLNALELAKVTEFIPATAAGLNLPLAEGGANWSYGQRTRIALAQGILAARDSGLILLDEPTANLDSKAERSIYSNLTKAFQEVCLISSVHRLELLDYFDEVILMNMGRVLAQAPIAAMRESEEFRRLFAASLASRPS